MRRHRSPSRPFCCYPLLSLFQRCFSLFQRRLSLPQRRQHAQQAPPLRPIVPLWPYRPDQVGEMGRHALAREMRPVRDLVRECFGDGSGRENADGGVRGREAVVEEGGEDLFSIG